MGCSFVALRRAAQRHGYRSSFRVGKGRADVEEPTAALRRLLLAEEATLGVIAQQQVVAQESPVVAQEEAPVVESSCFDAVRDGRGRRLRGEKAAVPLAPQGGEAEVGVAVEGIRLARLVVGFLGDGLALRDGRRHRHRGPAAEGQDPRVVAEEVQHGAREVPAFSAFAAAEAVDRRENAGLEVADAEELRREIDARLEEGRRVAEVAGVGPGVAAAVAVRFQGGAGDSAHVVGEASDQGSGRLALRVRQAGGGDEVAGEEGADGADDLGGLPQSLPEGVDRERPARGRSRGGGDGGVALVLLELLEAGREEASVVGGVVLALVEGLEAVAQGPGPGHLATCVGEDDFEVVEDSLKGLEDRRRVLGDRLGAVRRQDRLPVADAQLHLGRVLLAALLLFRVSVALPSLVDFDEVLPTHALDGAFDLADARHEGRDLLRVPDARLRGADVVRGEVVVQRLRPDFDGFRDAEVGAAADDHVGRLTGRPRRRTRRDVDVEGEAEVEVLARTAVRLNGGCGAGVRPSAFDLETEQVFLEAQAEGCRHC
mmetsp:Transcript_7050/g.23113  ORF Transcript_7050/g.23113 Transcript_7050/m.23113 type:complete len:543 (-) Transcript_7050:4534-6162(-)